MDFDIVKPSSSLEKSTSSYYKSITSFDKSTSNLKVPSSNRSASSKKKHAIATNNAKINHAVPASLLTASLFSNTTKEESDATLLYKTLRRFPQLTHEQRQSFLLSLLTECDPYDMLFLKDRIPRLHRDFLELLPLNTKFKVLSLIHPRDLCTVAGVCKKWRRTLQNADLWAQLYTNMGLQSMCDSYYDPNEPMRANARKLHALGNWVNGVFRFQSVKAHASGILGVAFRDKTFVTAGADRLAKVWEIRTGQCLHTLAGHEGAIHAVVYDDQKIITGSADSTIRIWSVNSGVALNVINGHKEAVTCLKLLNPQILVSGSSDKSVKVFQIMQKTVEKSQNTRLSSTKDGKISPLSPINGKLGPLPHNKHPAQPNNLLPNTYEVTTLRTLRGHKGGIKAIDCTNEIILSGDVHGEVKVWHVHSGNCLTTITPPAPQLEPIFALEFSRTRLCIGAVSGYIYLYAVNPYDQYMVSSVPSAQYESLREWANKKFTWTLVRKYDLRERGRDIKTVSGGKMEKDALNVAIPRKSIASIDSRRKGSFTLQSLGSPSEQSAFTLSGSDVAGSSMTVGNNNTADRESAAETVFVSKKTEVAQMTSVWTLSVAMDEWRLMSGSSEGVVKIWNHRTGKHIYTLEDNMVESRGVLRTLSYDDFELPRCLGGEDDDDFIDNAGKVEKEIDTSRAVTSVKFDDRFIVAGAMDGYVRIWEAMY